MLARDATSEAQLLSGQWMLPQWLLRFLPFLLFRELRLLEMLPQVFPGNMGPWIVSKKFQKSLFCQIVQLGEMIVRYNLVHLPLSAILNLIVYMYYIYMCVYTVYTFQQFSSTPFAAFLPASADLPSSLPTSFPPEGKQESIPTSKQKIQQTSTNTKQSNLKAGKQHTPTKSKTTRRCIMIYLWSE